MTLELTGLLLLGVAGLVLAIWGVRGKVVRVGPTCRRCRYDLAASAGNTARCPECGADLRAPRAVLPRLRARRPLALVLGALVLCSAATLGVVVGSSRFASPAVQALLPNWVLILETSLAPTLEAPALTELANRVPNIALPQADLDALVQRALALQADLTTPWRPEWGALVESAQTSARLAPADWATYARQALELTIAVRPVVQAGRTIPAKVESRARRLGQAVVGPLAINTREELMDGGFTGRGMTTDISYGTSSTSWINLEVAQPGTLLQVRVLEVTVTLAGMPGTIRHEKCPLVTLVVPPGVATCQPVDDAEAIAALHASLRLDRLNWSESPGQPGHLSLSFSGKGSAHPLAFEVLARDSAAPDQPWVRIGTLCNQTAGSWGHSMGGEWPGSRPRQMKVDVLLRASQDAAEDTVDLQRYLRTDVLFNQREIDMPLP